MTLPQVRFDRGVLKQTPIVSREDVNNSGPTLLLVDDEESLRHVLRARLAARGYLTHEAATGEDALRVVPSVRPDVIILDIGLPGIDGIEVTRRVRTFAQTPIIMLSVRSSDSDKIAALNAGADDYLVKPCNLSDLLATIHMSLFRQTIGEGPVVTLGDFLIDLAFGEVRVGANPVILAAGEYDLLRVLILNVGRLLTQSRLAQEVFGQHSEGEALQMLRATMTTLRQKLDSANASTHSCHIKAEPGVGYRLRIGPLAKYETK